MLYLFLSYFTPLCNFHNKLLLKNCCFHFRITEDSLFFKALGLPENKNYEVTLNFFKKINPDKVLQKNSGRCYEFIITKADTKSEYWPSLTNDKKKPPYLKVDFNKWKDEGSDDEDENAFGDPMAGMGGGLGGMGNFNDLMSSMGGMGGADGKPTFDDLDDEQEDSDDDQLPDLEEAKK